MIPTSIDGTDITGATIDGTDVTEITVDGQTVFTAGLASHIYDADSLSLANGDPVNVLSDSVGSVDFDVTTDPPSYNTSGINGLGTIEADKSEFLRTDSTGFGISNPFTIIAVAELVSSSEFQHLYEHDTNRIQIRSDNSGRYEAKDADNNGFKTGRDFDPHIFTVDWSTNSVFYLDGTQVASDNQTVGSDLDELTLFRSADEEDGAWNLGELRIYENILSSSDRSSEETELSSKWGISI